MDASFAAHIRPLLNLSSVTGSMQITSTVPIVSLSLYAEAFPVFSVAAARRLAVGGAAGNRSLRELLRLRSQPGALV
jgi:hypothetical protein